MNREDPLERAFELLKADSTELAWNRDLEDKLVNELQRHNRPGRLKKWVLVAAGLAGLLVAGGGISLAAGINPLRVWVLTDRQGNTGILRP